LVLAALLDNPRAVTVYPQAAAQLVAMLASLRKRPRNGRRLTAVQAMSNRDTTLERRLRWALRK
jgi:hypothetical protein